MTAKRCRRRGGAADARSRASRSRACPRADFSSLSFWRYVAFSESICSFALLSLARASFTLIWKGCVVEAEQQVAALHALVVVHAQLDYPAGHVGADGDARGVHIGIVGRFVAAAGEVQVSREGRGSTATPPIMIGLTQSLGA